MIKDKSDIIGIIILVLLLAVYVAWIIARVNKIKKNNRRGSTSKGRCYWIEVVKNKKRFHLFGRNDDTGETQRIILTEDNMKELHKIIHVFLKVCE